MASGKIFTQQDIKTWIKYSIIEVKKFIRSDNTKSDKKDINLVRPINNIFIQLRS